MLFLKILGAVLALAIGLYMGSSGRYRPDPEEIDEALGEGGYSHRVKTRISLPWGGCRQTQERSSHIRRRSRGTSSRRCSIFLRLILQRKNKTVSERGSAPHLAHEV